MKQYSEHEVAYLIADAIGDNCACNVNGNNEWLAFCCDYKDDEFCPDITGVACWEQYIKHLPEKENVIKEYWG